MKYNELQVVSTKNNKRVGRGIAAGRGKTAGRGTKGQKSRTGSSRKPGFEGGQNPLMQRLPKLRGFTSHKKETEVVYTGVIDSLGAKVVDNASLFEAGLITTPYRQVKLILNGDVTKKLTVKLARASASAVEQIEKLGGTFEVTAVEFKKTKAVKSDEPKETKVK